MKGNGNGGASGTLNELDKIKFLKTVALVAAPIALQSLIGSSLNLVDNLMIGHLGELPLNAVGVSVQIFFVYWMFVFGFAILFTGCSSSVLQAEQPHISPSSMASGIM